MTDNEKRLLVALVCMADQYLGHKNILDHQFMTAGERATHLLIQYGLVKVEGPDLVWTDAGRDFLKAAWSLRGIMLSNLDPADLPVPPRHP